MDMNNYYRTKDISLASFLYSSNKKLFKFTKENGIVWFIFEDKKSCEELINSFWQKEAMVNAKEFVDSLRTIKDLIFNARAALEPFVEMEQKAGVEIKKALKTIKALEDKNN